MSRPNRSRLTLEVLEGRSLPAVSLIGGFASGAVRSAERVATPAILSTQATIESGQVVLDWNALALKIIATAQTPPPRASRALAMMHIAMADAVNSVHKTYAPILASTTAAANASALCAANRAAHDAMAALYPTYLSDIHALYFQKLATLAPSMKRVNGNLVGIEIAKQVLAARANDGSDVAGSYAVSNIPGRWVPTPPAFAAPLLPAWGKVKPFAMTSGRQFRPFGPPKLNTAEYATELNEVKSLGAKNSTTRTADQTVIATFWADGAGTYTPPGHWNAIAAQFAKTQKLDIVKAARLFAHLDMATADAGINAWDAKYAYNLWRPITAIRNADLDNNTATVKDAAWEPLLTTPPFPEYTSGHSTFSGAAAAILEAYFGANTAFSTKSYDGKVTRSFASFNDAALEAGKSRIYGGIHFQSANEDGLAAGRKVAEWVLKTVPK